MTTGTRLTRTLPVMALLAGLLALATPAPARAAVECVGTLSGVTVNDRLVVPVGEECILELSTVTGRVEVEPGGNLFMNRSEVWGKVEADEQFNLQIIASEVRGGVEATDGDGNVVRINGSRIGGNVELSGNDLATDLQVIGTTVQGHLTVEENQVLEGARIIHITDNAVGGSLRINENTAASEIRVEFNAVGGSLTCEDNVPAPIGGGNVAGADKDGQCANL